MAKTAFLHFGILSILSILCRSPLPPVNPLMAEVENLLRKGRWKGLAQKP